MIILFIFDFWIVVVTQYDKVAFSWFGFLCPLSSAPLVQGFRSARPLPLSFQSELPTFRNVNSQMKRARFCNKICLGVVNVDVVLVCVCINHIEQSHNLPIRNLASFEADEFYLVHLGFGVKNHLFFFFVIFTFFFLRVSFIFPSFLFPVVGTHTSPSPLKNHWRTFCVLGLT